MKAIEFPEQTLVIAKDQPQYAPLPAHVDLSSNEVVITFCWKLSFRERLGVLFCGNLWHQVLTFGQPLQPQRLDVQKPNLQRQE
jgi:hypothetical protein